MEGKNPFRLWRSRNKMYEFIVFRIYT
jgi:hypothetical protein